MANHESTESSRFPTIPVSLQDLEQEPYHLEAYPANFDCDNGDDRAHQFAALVQTLEQENRTLCHASADMMTLFVDDEEGDDDPWMEPSRMQALYTLVR